MEERPEPRSDARDRAHTSGAVEPLRDDTLVVFLSDVHVGGDPGQDYFESPENLTALFRELAEYAGLVELVLADDFFDLLKIGHVRAGENRASVTISRPGYL